ncbi:hypothetical protein AD006_31310 (plasmid) [Pseudonocardia sp. EC080610-09]|nr:hypothetical protein AD006_31310 [Pseudonocardia sp. EC080610-09]
MDHEDLRWSGMDAVRQLHTNHGRSSPFKTSQVVSSHELDQRLRSVHLIWRLFLSSGQHEPASMSGIVTGQSVMGPAGPGCWRHVVSTRGQTDMRGLVTA